MKPRLAPRIFAGLFVTLLGVGFVAQIAHVQLTPELDENRRKAAPPRIDWSYEKLSLFPSEFERWFNDHFGLRSTLIRWNSVFRNLVLNTPSSKSVIFGKDGWLFFTGNSSLKLARNALPLSDLELADIARGLQAHLRWFKERGILYVMVIAPNSQTVYPEFLPDYLRRKAQPHSRIDQVASLAKEIGLPLIDLREALLSKKQEGMPLLYQKTDTHWSELGAYYASESVFEYLRQLYGNVGKPAPFARARHLNGFTVSVSRQPGGDLARTLGLDDVFTEEAVQVRSKESADCHVTKEGASSFTTTCPDAPPSPRTLVFRDSFFIALQPYFSPRFREIRFVTRTLDRKEIEDFKPTLVIEELVGRRFPLSW